MEGPNYKNISYNASQIVKNINKPSINKTIEVSPYNSNFIPFFLKRKFNTFTYAPIIYFSGCKYLLDSFHKYFNHLEKPTEKIEINLNGIYELSSISKNKIYTICVDETDIDCDINIINMNVNFVFNELMHLLKEKAGAILFYTSSLSKENSFLKSYCDLFFCNHSILSENIKEIAPLNLIVNLEISDYILNIDKTTQNSELKCL